MLLVTSLEVEHNSLLFTLVINNIQTHKMFRRMLIYLDTSTQSANVHGNPFS